MNERELRALLTPETLPEPLDPAPVVRRGRRARRQRLALRALAGGAVALAAGTVAAPALTGRAPAPAPDVLAADPATSPGGAAAIGSASPSAAPTQAAGPSTVSGDAGAVPACMRAVERTGEVVDRSVDAGLTSLPGGWRVTVVAVSGRSLDCDVTPSGAATVVPAPPARQGTVRELLGLQHLACRAAEPGLLAVTSGAPDAEEQARAALAQALPHLHAATVRAVAEPFRARGPVAELRAIYRFCLDNNWGGNRALLGP